MLPSHLERSRDRAHYVRCAELASACGVLENAELALERMREFALDSDRGV